MISKSVYYKIKIPIPSLKKQKKIVKKMDILHNSVKTSQSLIKQLKQTFNIRMEVFTRGCKEFKKLGDICEINPNSIKKGEFDVIRYIDLSTVDKGTIMGITKIHIDEAPSRAKRKVKINDVLLGTVRPKLQNNAYITPEVYSKNLVVSTGFCVLRCKVDNPKYLFYYLSSDRIKKELSLKATGSSYPAVNTTVVKNTKIPIPPLKKQKKIVEEMNSLMELIKHLEQNIEENQRLMKTIITP